MPADVARQDHCIAKPHALRLDRTWRDNRADAAGIDEQPICLAAIDDLEIAGHDADTGRLRGVAHRCDDAHEERDAQSFLKDEAGAYETWPRPAHGKVVDRAVDGERTYVATRKDQRLDHIGIGGEGERARQLQSRSVMPA